MIRVGVVIANDFLAGSGERFLKLQIGQGMNLVPVPCTLLVDVLRGHGLLNTDPSVFSLLLDATDKKTATLAWIVPAGVTLHNPKGSGGGIDLHGESPRKPEGPSRCQTKRNVTAPQDRPRSQE
jgi:hypothetical protein